MANATSKQVTAIRRGYYVSVVVCVAVIVLVHLVPKGLQYGDPKRLFYTAAFFTGSIYLCYLMLAPRRRMLDSVYRWRYADAPQPLERAWRGYLYSLDQAVTIGVYLLLVLLVSLTMMTMAEWFPRLRVLSAIYNPLWWIGLGSLLLFPLFGGFLFSELTQRYRVLHEQLNIGVGFEPRSLRGGRGGSHDATPLEIRDHGAFRAGGEQWEWDEFTRSCVVFGMPGSGKTSCVLNAVLEGVLGAAERARVSPAVLLLDPKGDFREKIGVLCQKFGRRQDLLVIDPHAPERSIRWNPLDSDDDPLEIAARFSAVLQALGMESGENSFWIDAAQRFVQHAIDLVRRTNPVDTPPSFADLYALSTSFRAIADRTDRLDPADPTAEACLAFFTEWVEMAPNQRSGIQSHVSNMLDPFLMEPYASLFSGRSTVKIADVVAEGRVLYVHMPVADKQAMARTIGVFVKMEYYREVLKALNKPRPSLFLCDEFQQFATHGQGSGDSDFFERSRQSNHANIIATQNLPGLLRGAPQREAVTNLLGNCGTKVFLRNDDDETNEYASKLFGEEIGMMGGAAGQVGGRGIGPRMIQQNDQFVRRVSADSFKDLGVPHHGDEQKFCEAYAYLGTRHDSRVPRKLRWALHPITA